MYRLYPGLCTGYIFLCIVYPGMCTGYIFGCIVYPEMCIVYNQVRILFLYMDVYHTYEYILNCASYLCAVHSVTQHYVSYIRTVSAECCCMTTLFRGQWQVHHWFHCLHLHPAAQIRLVWADINLHSLTPVGSVGSVGSGRESVSNSRFCLSLSGWLVFYPRTSTCTR